VAYACLLALLLGSLACAGAAGPDPQANQEQDILAAVQIHLRAQGKVNPDSMKMELTSLALDGARAVATIRFTSPDGASNLEVQYELLQEDDGWKVTASGGGGGHGQGQAPPGLPPDHPPVPQDPPAEDAPEETPASS
jgi:hypothetical protein